MSDMTCSDSLFAKDYEWNGCAWECDLTLSLAFSTSNEVNVLFCWCLTRKASRHGGKPLNPTYLKLRFNVKLKWQSSEVQNKQLLFRVVHCKWEKHHLQYQSHETKSLSRTQDITVFVLCSNIADCKFRFTTSWVGGSKGLVNLFYGRLYMGWVKMNTAARTQVNVHKKTTGNLAILICKFRQAVSIPVF